jgi:transcriptional regulator with XRE-family HTH domain
MADSLSLGVFKFLEEKKKLSNMEIAALVSVSPSEISRIKKGERKWTLSQLEKLADHYQLPLALFLLDAVRDLDHHHLNDGLRNLLTLALEELDAGRREAERTEKPVPTETLTGSAPRGASHGASQPSRPGSQLSLLG